MLTCILVVDVKKGQSEPAPTSAPTWMDGALIGFSFLSLCHPRFTFFCLPFLSPDLSFFFATLFYPRPLPRFFFLLLKLFSSTHLLPPPPPPLSATNLLTYIFELKVDSSPSTYSPINLKCATLIPTHLRTPHLFVYLPTLCIGTYQTPPTWLHLLTSLPLQ
jgi:hypothetical protein